MQHQIVNEKMESTDALWDVSPRAMAARFGARARLNIQRGEHAHQAARLAASYAFMAEPSLRLDARPASSLSDFVWRLGTELNRAAVDRLVH